MKFKLDIDIPAQQIISKHADVFLVGSCFAQYNAEKFRSLGFATLSNPFGITYNPASIENQIARIDNLNEYNPTDFSSYHEHYFSWEHHGNHAIEDINKALSNSNDSLKSSRDFIQKSSYAIITLGTSLVFRLKENNMVVNNCHKMPSQLFKHEQLSVKEVNFNLESIEKHLLSINPNLTIIWTISPIRHWRSGVVQSSLSKAILRTALHEHLTEKKQQYYFPSFEIFIDELRDYRFSKEDLCHPTEQALSFIWSKFTDTYFTSQMQQLCKEIIEFRKFENHIPRTNQEMHLKAVETKRKIITSKYPKVLL